MAFSPVSILRGPGEITAMVVQVAKVIVTKPFQFREFIEQAWFITSVTLVPAMLVSIPFGAVPPSRSRRSSPGPMRPMTSRWRRPRPP